MLETAQAAWGRARERTKGPARAARGPCRPLRQLLDCPGTGGPLAVRTVAAPCAPLSSFHLRTDRDPNQTALLIIDAHRHLFNYCSLCLCFLGIGARRGPP